MTVSNVLMVIIWSNRLVSLVLMSVLFAFGGHFNSVISVQKVIIFIDTNSVLQSVKGLIIRESFWMIKEG